MEWRGGIEEVEQLWRIGGGGVKRVWWRREEGMGWKEGGGVEGVEKVESL